MSASTTYDPLTGIDWRTRLSVNDNAVYGFNVYLYPAGTSVLSDLFGDPGEPETVTAQDWNEYEQTQLASALQSFENIINVTFGQTEQITSSTLRLIAGTFPDDETPGPENTSLGVFGTPGTGIDAGLGGFNTAASLWSDEAGGPLDVGGQGYITLIHELGHGLGLAHPHDNGGGSTIFPGVTASMGSYGEFELNQSVYTMMSYNDGWATAPQGEPPSNNYGFNFTPMAFDIAVLQRKYGANTSYHTGNDTYVLPDSNETGTGYSAIWDAGGSDMMSYAGSSDAILDLRPATLKWEPGGGGFISYVEDIFGGFTIANGVTIEAAISGSGNDVLHGNDAGNFLNANAGNNTVIGGAGNDVINSATGNDLIETGDGHNLVILGSGRGTVGSSGFDTVIGGSGAATVDASGSNSALIFGGSGQLAFLNDSGSSTVVAGTGKSTAFGGTGTLTMWGNTGSDLAVGGTAGRNLLVSGTQATTLVGGGSGDLLIAGGGNNVLLAAAGNSTLIGSSGRSVMIAGAGNDDIVLGSGNDTIFGGSGGQTAVFGGIGKGLIVGNQASLYVQAGSGQSTVFAGSGTDLFGFVAGYGSGGTELISGFSVGQDRIALQGYGPGAAAAALSSATVANGSTTIVLSDNTRIIFSAVSNLNSSVFV